MAISSELPMIAQAVVAMLEDEFGPVRGVGLDGGQVTGHGLLVLGEDSSARSG
jgi:hypothetical protein